MKNDGTDWETLVEKRLAEARRDRQAEAQASEPPPGPEAAAKVIDRFRASSGTDPEAPSAGEAPGRPPARAPREYSAAARESDETAGRRHRHHRFSWHRAKRTLFLLALLALFLAGLALTFSPQLKHILHFLGPDRDTAGDGLVAPPEPPGKIDKPEKPKEPKPPASETPPVPPADPHGIPGVQQKPPQTNPPAAPVPEKKDPPAEPKRDPPEKPPEKKPDDKPMLPLEPAKPVDPSLMPAPPKPPEPPKLPAMPKGPWDTQGKGEGRPVEPRDSVG